MSLIRPFAIRNELLYSGFVLPNVQIFFVQKISFATFGVSIDDFLTRYAGLGFSLTEIKDHTKNFPYAPRTVRCECEKSRLLPRQSLITYAMGTLICQQANKVKTQTSLDMRQD